MGYKFIKNSPEKYKDIQQLKKRSMGVYQEMIDIQKKYNTSIFGSRDIGFFAKNEEGFPAAYYGVFPIKASYKGKSIIIAQSGDTMTDPDHRKKGLFTKLAVETYKYANENGISFIFGFPNEFSYPGFKKKLDWKFFGNMYKFELQTNSFPLNEIAKKYPALKSFYRNILEKRISKYKVDLTEDAIKSFEYQNEDFYINRDMAFYKYKEGLDKYLIKINGFTLFIRSDIHLFIGDVSRFEENTLESFIDTIKKLSKITLSRKVIITLSKTHWLYKIIERKIKPEKSLPIGYYIYSEKFPFEKMVLSMADYDTF